MFDCFDFVERASLGSVQIQERVSVTGVISSPFFHPRQETFNNTRTEYHPYTYQCQRKKSFARALTNRPIRRCTKLAPPTSCGGIADEFADHRADRHPRLCTAKCGLAICASEGKVRAIMDRKYPFGFAQAALNLRKSDRLIPQVLAKCRWARFILVLVQA